jgi:hypothetical protein
MRRPSRRLSEMTCHLDRRKKSDLKKQVILSKAEDLFA